MAGLVGPSARLLYASRRSADSILYVVLRAIHWPSSILLLSYLLRLLLSACRLQVTDRSARCVAEILPSSSRIDSRSPLRSFRIRHEQCL